MSLGAKLIPFSDRCRIIERAGATADINSQYPSIRHVSAGVANIDINSLEKNIDINSSLGI
jgi:hypothetical protein